MGLDLVGVGNIEGLVKVLAKDPLDKVAGNLKDSEGKINACQGVLEPELNEIGPSIHLGGPDVLKSNTQENVEVHSVKFGDILYGMSKVFYTFGVRQGGGDSIWWMPSKRQKFEGCFIKCYPFRLVLITLEEYLESQGSIESEFLCVDGGSWEDSYFG
jgi:hypothetical protein